MSGILLQPQSPMDLLEKATLTLTRNHWSRIALIASGRIVAGLSSIARLWFRGQQVISGFEGGEDWFEHTGDNRRFCITDTPTGVVTQAASTTDPLSGRSGHVVVGPASHHRRDDLLLPVRARPGYRPGPGEPADLQRSDPDVQDPDRGPDGVRLGRRGPLPRTQRDPHHLDRLLVGGPPPPEADVVDHRRHLLTV